MKAGTRPTVSGGFRNPLVLPPHSAATLSTSPSTNP
jgi:hypothetical protein